MAQNRIPLAGQEKTPPTERIAASFKQLAASSKELNAAGEDLTEVMSTVDAALSTVSPPVAAWHKIAGFEGEDGSYWHRDIGYAKVKNIWGIALRTVEGHECLDRDQIEEWLFRDAPRWMQIESVSKIPDLFDELIKRTKDTTIKLRAKTLEAKRLAAALAEALPDSTGQQK